MICSTNVVPDLGIPRIRIGVGIFSSPEASKEQFLKELAVSFILENISSS